MITRFEIFSLVLNVRVSLVIIFLGTQKKTEPTIPPPKKWWGLGDHLKSCDGAHLNHIFGYIMANFLLPPWVQLTIAKFLVFGLGGKVQVPVVMNCHDLSWQLSFSNKTICNTWLLQRLLAPRKTALSWKTTSHSTTLVKGPKLDQNHQNGSELLPKLLNIVSSTSSWQKQKIVWYWPRFN